MLDIERHTLLECSVLASIGCQLSWLIARRPCAMARLVLLTGHTLISAYLMTCLSQVLVFMRPMLFQWIDSIHEDAWLPGLCV